MVSKKMAILVLLLALPLLAFAQDQSSNQGMGGDVGTGSNTDRNMVPFGGGLYRLSQGANVAIRSENGDISGDVRDIIINGNGEFRFVVASISQGGQDNAGSEGGAYLVPIDRVRFDVSEAEFRFDFDADELSRLTRLEEGDIPAGLNETRSSTAPGVATAPDEPEPTGRIREYGSEPNTTAPGVATAPDEPEPTGTALRSQSLSRRFVFLSSLLGSDFTNLQGEDLGVIEDVVINIPQTRVEYMAVSTSGGLGLGERYFAVPMRVFIEAEPVVQQVLLDVRQEDFRDSRGFQPGGAWPGAGDETFGVVGDESFDVLRTGPDDD